MLDTANTALGNAAKITLQLESLSAEYSARQAVLEAEYAPKLTALKNELSAAEKHLTQLMKSHHKSIFSVTNQVHLPNGSLFFTRVRRVKRSKGLLAAIKSAGKLFLLKITEAVDWAKIEKLSDQELRDIGAERIVKDEYGFEVKKNGKINT